MTTSIDANELLEWQAAIDSLVEHEGRDYAQALLDAVVQHAQKDGLHTASLETPYANTISPKQQQAMPDDGRLTIELTNIMRWNAAVIVLRAVKAAKELGGHIASYGAIALLFEVGLQYFFKAEQNGNGGDLVFFQGHSSPGIYARAFLEGRFSDEQLDRYRREIGEPGLSSYPHPWLMPDFWQFPTVSMGLGPLMAIYQAQFLKYLDNRSLLDTKGRFVWAFCGDGEMDEVDSTGALNVAARDKLDNLVFVISCNLQCLDGPVYGNGQIIQELAGLYAGAGWHVIKVIWGTGWDELFSHPHSHVLIQRMGELVDGEQQTFASKGVDYFREQFFGKHPELKAMVADWSDEKLAALQDGGHDIEKVYAAYAQAVAHKDQPVVILAKTIKGFGMGASGEGLMGAHQQKSMKQEDLLSMRDRFQLPLTDQQVENLEYCPLEKDSEQAQYLASQREQLGGVLPVRRQQEAVALQIPSLSVFSKILAGAPDRPYSTTMAFSRCLGELLNDKQLGSRIVPILADEARTFGMEGLFRKIGVYSAGGQNYTPEDHKKLMYYRTDRAGQLLQNGLSEAGGFSSWVAAATSYSNNNFPMIPFYIYYSMFGFQRFGDLVWAAGDSRARGFILGAISGRTTIAGEGLQHQDGHNILMFDTVPNCVCYDPTFAYEFAVIMHHGLVRMYEQQENIFYYIAVLNENYAQPAMPENAEEGIIKGMYLLCEHNKYEHKVQLLGAGSILQQVIQAQVLLEEYSVSADIWSVPSFTEVYRDLRHVKRFNRLNPEKTKKIAHVTQCLQDTKGPVIAATDYIRLNADQIRAGFDKPYYVLGTDGFGRSDTRAKLRDHFEVNANMIAYIALLSLYEVGDIAQDVLMKARKDFNIDPTKIDPIEQ